MAKKNKLPEFDLSDDTDLKKAENLIKADRDVVEAEGRKDTLSEDFSRRCEDIRDTKAQDADYIGMIRAVTPEGACRCEFPLKGGYQDTSIEPTLNKHFGTSLPLVFTKTTVVTGISDLIQLLKDVSGKPAVFTKAVVEALESALEHLDIKIKKDHDEEVIKKSKAVETYEAFKPHDDILNNLRDLATNLNDEAKKWVRDYLVAALAPRVVVGTRGAKKKQ